VANTFAQRWNDDQVPNPDVSSSSWTAPGHDVPTISTALTASNAGTHHVQTLRTAGCSYVPSTNVVKGVGVNLPSMTYSHYPYAPRGETTILAALVRAINTAQNFIYVEDQYGIFVEDIKDALASALDPPGFQKLIVVQQDIHQSDAGKAGCAASHYAMWKTLEAAHPGKVQLHTRSDGAYTHSKTWVFDDALFVTGSANINRRSYTHDAELDVAVVDAATTTSADGVSVGTFVHDARLAMWAEHTGLSVSSLRGMTIKEAAAAFDSSASRVVRRIVLNSNDDDMPDLALCERSDPDGRRC